MSGFGYDVLGFGSGSGAAPAEVDDQFNRVSFLSRFDGANNGVNNVFDDGSASNHTMTARGVAQVGQGSFSPFSRPEGHWGVAFDGTGDRVRANWSDVIESAAFTIEAWVFISGAMSQYDCIAWLQELQGNSIGDSCFFIRANNANTIEFGVVASGTIYNTISSAVSLNEWHHFSLSKSGTTMYSSVDGTVTSRSAPSALSNAKYLNIGAADASGSLSNAFNGVISNVRFLKGTALYTSNFTVPTSPLTAITNTKFLGCQSNRFVDNSANNYAITNAGNAAVSAFGPFLTDAAYDPAVNAASAGFLTGTNTGITTPDSSDFDLGATFTIEAWVYAYTAPEYSFICGRWYDGSSGKVSSHYAFQLTPVSGVPQLAFGNPTTIGNAYGSAFPIGEWVHVAVTQDGSTKRLFQNGIMGTTYSSPTTVGSSGTKNFSVGAYDASNAQDGSGFSAVWDGHICDLRVLKGTALYTSNFTPPTAPLTAITNTKLLLNMKDGQIIDNTAQSNMTMIGDPKLSTGQVKFGDTSLYLDGTGFIETDRILLPYGPTDFTIEFWYYGLTKNNANAGYVQQIIAQYPAGTGTNRMSINYDENNPKSIEFFLHGSSSVSLKAASPQNEWVHIAMTRSGNAAGSANTIVIYVNGTAGATTTTSNPVYQTPLTIGGCAPLSQYNYDFKGYLSNLRITNGVRYTGNFTVPDEPFPIQGQI